MTSTRSIDLVALRGRTVLVTGGGSGIGLATTTALSRAGAHVVVAARSTDKATAAVAGLPTAVEVRHLDLADFASVRAFADKWSGPLDVLINNAGVSLPARALTPEGIEMQFATNVLGPFALTNLLLSHLRDRVVTLASQAERAARLDLDDLGYDSSTYSEFRAYNNSKLGDLLFTYGLQRRLEAVGSPIRAMAAHPGFVATDIYAQTTGFVPRLMIRMLAQGPEDGALPTLLAATADLPGGSFTGPERMLHMRGGAELIRSSARSHDVTLADRLWATSERLTGVGFGLARTPSPTAD